MSQPPQFWQTDATPDAGHDQAAEQPHYARRVPADAWQGDAPTSPTAEALVRAVAAEFTQGTHLSARVASIGHEDPGELALLFRAGPESIHVVGHNLLADELRAALLSGAAPGWLLHPVADPGTPLRLLQPHLSTRDYRLLAREGFTTVEDVVETPDKALLDLRHAGRKFLAAVRAATAQVAITHNVAHQAEPGAVADRRRFLDERLQPAQQLRYRDLIDGLAMSRLPFAALETIIDALNAEPLPPTDPIVTLLLETGDEAGLLDLYRQTHEPA
jgi:hypothetical protein